MHQKRAFRGRGRGAREARSDLDQDFKGKGVKILSAPGPANREAARAVFVANGLVEAPTHPQRAAKWGTMSAR